MPPAPLQNCDHDRHVAWSLRVWPPSYSVSMTIAALIWEMLHMFGISRSPSDQSRDGTRSDADARPFSGRPRSSIDGLRNPRTAETPEPVKSPRLRSSSMSAVVACERRPDERRIARGTQTSLRAIARSNRASRQSPARVSDSRHNGAAPSRHRDNLARARCATRGRCTPSS